MFIKRDKKSVKNNCSIFKITVFLFFMFISNFVYGANGDGLKAIASGTNHNIAIKNDSTLWAWGANHEGQLGDGTTSNKSIPINIGTATDWCIIAGGGYHTIAIKTDGTLWAWGWNFFCQLGDGTTIDKSTPTKIGTATDWKDIACGYYHTIAIKTDGTLWTWGYNVYGQLGDGTFSNKFTPIKIGTATDWCIIAGGGTHTIAIKTDGTLWAWGLNEYGQLGDGTTNVENIPTKIGIATDWKAIACGGTHTIAIKTDGTLWAWGYNVYGQLGDGTTWKNVPSKINEFTDLSTYIITSSAGSNGNISPLGNTTVNYGSIQTYNVATNTNYHVIDVLVDDVSHGGILSYTFNNVATTHTINASFGIDTYIINSSAGANGSILPLGNTTVNYSSNQTYNITPNTGYHVTDVLVDNVSQGAITNYTFNNVIANHTISASFTINTYTITSSAGVNGSISPSGSTLINYGSNKTYTITPNTDCSVSNVLVDGIAQGKILSYIFNNVITTHTINASFINIKTNFTADNTFLYLPGTVNFYDSSKGLINTWQWQFGDGTNSALQNPFHAYSSTGIYSVSLKVSGASGYDSCIKQNYIQIFTPNLQAPSFNNFGVKNSDNEATSYNPLLSVNNSNYDITKSYYKNNIRYAFEIYKDSGLTQKYDSCLGISEGNNTTVWRVSKELEENTTYWWIAWSYINGVKSNSMNKESFFVNKTNEAPTKPTFSYPADKSQVTETLLNLEFTNASDIDKDPLTYEFKIYDTSELIYIKTGISEDANGITKLSIELNDNTKYSWQARAKDIHGLLGDWMDTASFFVNKSNDSPSAPIIESPYDSSEVTTKTPVITIKNSNDLDNDVLTYFFEIDTVNTYNSNYLQQSSAIAEGAVTTSWQTAVLNDNTRRYIRVKSYDGKAYSSWTNAATIFINTQNDAPKIPVLISPKQTVLTSSTPELSVNPSTDLDNDKITYEYRILDVNDNLITLVNDKGTIWKIDSQLADNNKYFWQAQAKDEHGMESGWSDKTWFIVNHANEAPGVPKPNSPTNDISIDTQLPELVVANATDPDKDMLLYNFQVYDDLELNSSLIAETVYLAEGDNGYTKWILDKQLEKGKTYWWRVRANDGIINGSWSRTFSFNIKANDEKNNAETSSKKGPCVISNIIREKSIINKLNKFRDNSLLNTRLGIWIADAYYMLAPSVK